MAKAIESLAGSDLTTFREVIRPHVEAVIPPATVASLDAAKSAAGAAAILPSAPVTLPKEVTGISGGVGTGTGGTPGTYAGGVSGGPDGFAWTYTIGSDGKLAGYAILKPGISTSSTAPTLSLPTGGITGATVPTATVGTVPVGRVFWGVTADSASLALWQNVAGALAAVNAPDGSQVKIAAKALASAGGSTAYTPLVIDVGTGKSVLGLANGLLDFAGLSLRSRQKVAAQLSSDGLVTSKASVPSRGNPALYTDTRGMPTTRRKVAKIQAGQAAILRIGLMGHSWHDFLSLPTAIATRVFSYLGLTSPSAGVGFIPSFQQTYCVTMFRTVTYSSSGAWTQQGGPGGQTSPSQYRPPRSAGPDARCVWSTGTGWYQWGNVEGNKITLYYWDGNGTFKTTIDGVDTVPDGGGSATIVCGGTNTHKKLVFTLAGSGTATHTVKVDLVGNTGTVELYGLLAQNTSITSGVMFIKTAVSGSRAMEYPEWSTAAGRAWWATELDLDLGIAAIIVNDYDYQTPLEYFRDGLASLMSIVRGDKLLVTEPLCGITGKAIAQASFVAAAQAVADANGWERCDMSASWQDYTTENAVGQWFDPGHINNANASGAVSTDANGSARRYANEICNNYIFR